MSVPVEVPKLGESVTEAFIAEWLKKEGDFVEEDEIIAELDTDKISVEVPAPVSGTIASLKYELDDSVHPGDVLAEIEEGEKPAGADDTDETADDTGDDDGAAEESGDEVTELDGVKVGPAARRIIEEEGLDASDIEATGPRGHITKTDVLSHQESETKDETTESAPASAPQTVAPSGATEERVKMSNLRKTVARRLVKAQQDTAMLTTFNDVDMSAVMELRSKYRDKFQDQYDIKLGFMSFFIKACIEALKDFPAVNAEIDEDEIVYKNYYNVGVAVGGGDGLVVPVIKNADQLSFAQTEQELSRLVDRALNSKLTLDELQGGTFTISNGGIYGSMLSTPILNPPQSGILGMHRIEERPVAIDGEVEIRPMMYLALSYDHRIIDGKEAVSFLVRVKECIENPERILLEV